MKKRYIYIFATVFLIAIGINIISLIGINIWGYNEIWQNNNRSKQFEVPYEEYLAEQEYREYYRPKIDSLLQVNPNLAIPYIEKVIAKYPNEYFLELYQGIGYYKIDSFEMAYKKFQRSIEKNGSEYPRAIHYSGLALLKLKKYDEALIEFKKASKINDEYNYDMATVFELKGDYPNAIMYYKKEIQFLKKINALAYYKDIAELERKISILEKSQ